jgi:hypothetical protein
MQRYRVRLTQEACDTVTILAVRHQGEDDFH